MAFRVRTTFLRLVLLLHLPFLRHPFTILRLLEANIPSSVAIQKTHRSYLPTQQILQPRILRVVLHLFPAPAASSSFPSSSAVFSSSCDYGPPSLLPPVPVPTSFSSAVCSSMLVVSCTTICNAGTQTIAQHRPCPSSHLPPSCPASASSRSKSYSPGHRVARPAQTSARQP
jgi:hypothetical protein